jgi:RecB family exonuclease
MPEEATVLYAIPGLGFQDLFDRYTASIHKNPLTSWLILPTDTLVRQAKDQLAGRDNVTISDRICTPDELCLFLLFEYGEGITFISDSDSRLLLSRVIADHSKELSLFMSGGSPSGRMLTDLKRLFSYIIRNDLTYPDCLENLQTRKSEQIGVIYTAFYRRLKRLSYVTSDTLIQWVIENLKRKSPGEILPLFTHVYWLGQYSPAPLEKRLIQTCAGVIPDIVYAALTGEDFGIFGGDASWVYPGRKYISVTIPASERDKAVTSLFTDTFAEKSAVILRDTFSLTEWKDPVSELSGIAKEILRLRKQNIPWEDFAVVFPDPDNSLVYLADVFDDYHIPYHCSAASHISASPLVSFFLLLGECVEKGFRYEELIRLVRSPYLNYTWIPTAENSIGGLLRAPGGTDENEIFMQKKGSDHSGKRLDYESMDLICRSYGITGGYIDWEGRFEQIIGYISGENESEKAEDGERKGSTVYIPKRPLPRETILLTLEGILSLIQLLRNLLARNTVPDHCQVFRSILQNIGSPVPGYTNKYEWGIELSEEELIALESFDQVLTVLGQQPESENEILSFPEFLSRLRLLLMDKKISTEYHNGVFVTGISDIEQMQVPYVFLASLNEGLIPRLTYRLPFVNGSESGKIGDDLHAYLRKERYRFISACLAGREHVYLSSFEHRDERTALCSSFLGPFKQAGSFPVWGEETSLPEPDLFSDSENAYYSGTLMSLSRWDEALSFFPDNERVSDIVSRIGIERNFRFRLNRSEYDGIIGDGPGIRKEMEERFGPSYLWSASLIESYGRCPYRFYLEHILHIKPLPMLGIDISPDAKGRLIHSVVCRFKRRIHDMGGFPLRPEKYHDAVSSILEIACEELDTVSYETPVWLAKRRQLMGGERYGAGVFEKYVAAEIARLAPDEEGEEPMQFVPKHFEFSFGAVHEENDDPASVNDPVDLTAIAIRRLDEKADLPWTLEDIPKGLLLCGKIDRIDITDTGVFGVVDYKTGIKIPSTTEITSGKALQLPLYLMAFAEITGNTPVYGSYCHLHRSVTHAMSLYNPVYKNGLPRGKMPRSESKWEDIMDNALFQACRHSRQIHHGIFPIHADRGCSPDWFCPYKTICRFQPDRGSHLGEWIQYPEGMRDTGDASDDGLTGGKA